MNTTARWEPGWNGLNTTIRPFIAFFVVAGLIGNTLVLVLFCRLKRLKTWDNVFTVNLAVSDLTASVAATALSFTPEFLTARIVSCHSLSVMQVCRVASFLCLQEIALSSIGRVFRPLLRRRRKMAALPLPAAILDDLIPSFRFREWGHPRWRPEAEGPPSCASASIGVEKRAPSLGWRHFRRRHLESKMAVPHVTSGGRRDSHEILRKGWS